jgi:DNA-binding transcriptional LysR family regulator
MIGENQVYRFPGHQISPSLLSRRSLHHGYAELAERFSDSKTNEWLVFHHQYSRRAQSRRGLKSASRHFVNAQPIPKREMNVTHGETQGSPSERLDGYLKRSGVKVAPRFGIDNFAMAMSLVTSEQGVALLPISAEAYLPPTIVSRRLKGEQPTVDLMIGYRKGNAAPILKTFLSRIDGLIGRRPRSRAK